MAEYLYPAVFHPNDDGAFTITYPDLPGCISEGKNLSNAVSMAQSALAQWIGYLTDKQMEIPAPSEIHSVKVSGNEFVNLVCASVKDDRAVRRTVSLPRWMDERVSEVGLSLSKVLQDALKEKFGVA